MKSLLRAIWREDRGVLTFEWVLLTTLVTIGIVSGLTAARDATIEELSDVAEAMISLDQSYIIDNALAAVVHTPPDLMTDSQASGSGFTDQVQGFAHCERGQFVGLPPQTDCGGQAGDQTDPLVNPVLP